MMYMYCRIGFIFIFSIAFLSISCRNKGIDDSKNHEERVLKSSEELVYQQVNKAIRNGDNEKFEILITEIKDINELFPDTLGISYSFLGYVCKTNNFYAVERLLS